MQIRNIPLIFILSIAPACLVGQQYFDWGYVVNHSNDTLYGKVKDIKPGSFPRIYQKIRFVEQGSAFRKKYNPDQIRGYRSGERIYESIGVESESHFLKTRYFIKATSRKSFLRVMRKGDISYYHWEYIDNGSAHLEFIPLLHRQGMDEMVRVTQGALGMKKKMLTQYFSDCPELVSKIENEEVKSPEGVIELYKYLCRTSE
jgi:hypothetical protein